MNRNKRNRIKLLLKGAGVKQKRIAGALGVSAQFVNQVVSGERSTPRIRKAIAEATGKKISDLWPDQESDQEQI